MFYPHYTKWINYGVFSILKTSKSIQHLQSININDEWETLQKIVDEACKNYKINPVMDVAATFENKKFECFISKYCNALNVDWNFDFFMNPPYSQIKDFMKKAYYDHLNFNVNGLILTYAKTDTKWWHSYVEERAEIHFIKGRLKFALNGIVSKYSAPYPSCWIIYRRKKLG